MSLRVVASEKTDISQHRPRFSATDIAEFVRERYGFSGELRPLPSDKDQNFALDTPDGARYVVKISHALETRELLEAQLAVIEHLKAANLTVQDVVRRDGAYIWSISDESGRSYFLRILTYLDGVLLANVKPHSDDLIASLGAYLGRVDEALEGFDHPALHRKHRWDLQQAVESLDDLAPHLDADEEKALVDHFRRQHADYLEPRKIALRKSIIHNDANDYNVLINGPRQPDRQVVGLIDFGDAMYTWTVAEPAVAAAYAALDKRDPLHAAATLIGAYHKRNRLTEDEIAVLPTLIGLRLTLSICVSAYQRRCEPSNEYLVVSRKAALRLLHTWSQIPPRLAEYVLRSACGLEPCPRSKEVVKWLEANSRRMHAVVENASNPLVFDFSVGSKEWSFAELIQPGLAANKIARRIQDADAGAGIGRYDEVRLAYQGEQFIAGEERRTVHTGLDVFQEPGSIVRAPLAAVVHSLADNDRAYDYGPTVILEHRPPDGPVFYTLYGHLSRASLEGLAKGMEIAGGDPIGVIGDIHENGGWAPHLHLQLITDLLDREGDFPGVATPRQRDVWLSLSPDPQLIAGFVAGANEAGERNEAQLQRRRRASVGPSLSISYQRPIQVRRGYMQSLYDSEGRRYLDAVNNVAHVGHSHPRVVEAVAKSMQVLNTNTRYLYGELVEFAERLAATLPDPLEVCFFVNSGSEANDLAVRIARAYTGRRDVVVVDHAYHGNLSSLIEISPYKFNGPGGLGRPDHTHVVPMPDPLRPSGGAKEGTATIEAASSNIAAFISESIMSCGGQVPFPEGYLQALFRAVKEAGGVAISDEVQTGFGRVGAAFWAFELQGVVPDIVTMGKPIGNGHPLGAVVTTRAVADSFDNGMEYFNTFGGNPVACSAGLAVLDVLQEEGLQAHARKVGEHFTGRLREIAERHSVVGDVRGSGLFLGVELVRDRDTNTPASAEAGYVVERMREKGVLASIDGPYRNVIKIKPPMVFNARNVDEYSDALDEVLSEDFVAARLG